MPLINLVLKHIRVDNAGETEAEWDLTIAAAAAAGGAGSYDTRFRSDNVRGGGTVYPLNTGSWLFFLNSGEKIKFNTYGVELDGGLFDPNDILPGVGVEIDPASAGRDYAISIGGGEGAEFNYTIVMDVTSIGL